LEALSFARLLLKRGSNGGLSVMDIRVLIEALPA
jgi:hypothetical protein